MLWAEKSLNFPSLNNSVICDLKIEIREFAAELNVVRFYIILTRKKVHHLYTLHREN
jgi:hypothetical protein